jgi:hypothetical protein
VYYLFFIFWVFKNYGGTGSWMRRCQVDHRFCRPSCADSSSLAGQGRVSIQRFCDFSQSGDHSQNNLAKFGYALDMKVGIKKKKNPSIFFAIYWNSS